MTVPTSGASAGTGDLFGGGGDARAEVHRLFLALLPDEGVRRRIAAIADGIKPGYPARWVNPARYHLTLHFLGDHSGLRQDLVDAATRAAGKMRAAPFDLVLDRVDSFHGARPPCVLRDSGVHEDLRQLWRELRRALVLEGLGTHLQRRFVAHATLGYGRDAVLEPLAVEPVRWPVDAFHLVHSVAGRPDYRLLGTWPLAARD